MTSLFSKAVCAAAIAMAAGMSVQATAARAADVIIMAPGAPPEPRYEAVPPPPPDRGERVVWVRGHWRWDGGAWAWEPGHYVERPRHHARWVEGHWAHRPGGWVWVEGHWA